MTTVPLSQFQYKQKFLRLGIKNSKGCQKRIKLGQTNTCLKILLFI